MSRYHQRPITLRRPAPTRWLVFAACVLVMSGCYSPPPAGPEPVPPSAPVDAADADVPGDTDPRLEVVVPSVVGMDDSLPARLDAIVAAAMAEGVAPGVALAVGRHGRLVHVAGYGRIDHAPGSAAVDANTLFDLASLTKVVATTTAAMMLEEEGRLRLNARVVDHLPEFDAPEKAPITIRLLLEHRAGMEAFAPLFRHHRGADEYLRQINLRPLRRPPGSGVEYSDWDMVLLQLVVERVAGTGLDRFLHERLFAPLGMTSTLFNPPPELRHRIAATEVDVPLRGGLIHGAVHDPNAWAIGGVAGHAGLFASVRDLALFAQMMLNGGEHSGVRFLAPATIARWTAPQHPGASRALGWDTPSGRSSAGRHFGPRSFGHTGYTGTSLWLDPERGLFVVILTNRVNPSGSNQRHVPLRRDVADAVQRAVLDAPLVDWESRR
jgi:CubicO group peptidase (beta-lactamase class C family)